MALGLFLALLLSQLLFPVPRAGAAEDAAKAASSGIPELQRAEAQIAETQTARPQVAQTAPAALAYTLPPAQLAQARRLYRWRTALDLSGSLWSPLYLAAILTFGWASGVRNWANSVTRKRWLQGLCVLPPLLLLTVLFELPLSALAHHVSLAYGQSVQSWGSWFADWGKALLLNLFFGTLAFIVVFAIVRASPKRWWLWLWLIWLPAQVFVVFLLPIVIDPLFNRFAPLAGSQPELVDQMERIVAKTGINIPPTRMYLMRASEKVTGSNAYVTGFGGSKRVVVWDTTLKSLPRDEVLLVFGHELGHYVLNHIVRGLIIASLLSLLGLWLGFWLANSMIERWGRRWRILSLDDWGACVVFLLVMSLLAFFGEPIGNAISRGQEHAADVFGQEVVHGIVADPQRVAALSFQHLGEQSLDYPYPSSLVVFWTYSHPAIAAREAFAAQYNPWLPGKQPRYFSRSGRLLPHSFWSR